MSAVTLPFTLSHLDELESEAVHIMREVVAERERPVLLFSGGKDSIVLLRLAEKAFRPGGFPFPVMHVDTGHNFPEVIEFRDRRVAELGVKLVVASVQGSIDRGRVVEQTGPRASRNQLQTTTLLDAIEEHGFDAAMGGARRDEERARAKERIFSFRDDFGQWNPRAQRPELWNLYNGRIRKGEQIRVFPISNWTELDVWQYIAREQLELPSIYFAHERQVFRRDGMIYAVSDHVERLPGEDPFDVMGQVPHRRRHDLHRRGRVARVDDRRGRDRDRRHQCHRARRDPRRRPRLRSGYGRPQAGRVLLMATSEQMMQSELLRLVTAGSVDDGKSTLLGRLLYDTKQILADQLAHIEETSLRRGDGYVNLALLTDGLRAEREQGITIDVAYRSFVTPRRRFQLADAPGHVQYTRNMVTGASTADVAVILLDARNGIVEQTRRHSYIAAILAIPHVVVAVNKMDLVDFSAERFAEVEADLRDLGDRLGLHDLRAIPMSALRGDNVVERGDGMPWYEGPTLLEHLETVEIAGDRNLEDRRFPVQWVIRPMSDDHHDYRGYAGEVAGGIWRAGDDVVVLPSGRRTRVASVEQFDGPIEAAIPGQSVTVLLEDDLDVGRGDMLADPERPPFVAREVTAEICWMSERALEPGTRLAVKHTTRASRAVVEELVSLVDMHALEEMPSPERLGLNDLGIVRLRLAEPLAVDPYERNRTTGSFILIDESTNETVGAGMVKDAT